MIQMIRRHFENVVLVLVLLAFVLHATGCTNLTVVKLAELCHAEAGKPAASFNGSSGKVDCR